MSTTDTKQFSVEHLRMDTGRRRSMRVLLSVPIIVTGKSGAPKKEFTEETRTLVVNAHGALLTLAERQLNGDRVIISNKATQKSVECRIVYVGAVQAGKAQMGIEFEKPFPTFWQIDFPPEDWVVPEN
jgi:hypothetical protein